MDGLWLYVLWTLGAYAVGSIPVGDIIGLAKGVDVRSLGTGNPGAANVYRKIGPAYGVAVFTLDGVKGAAATLPLLLMEAPPAAAGAATAAVLAGHFLPIPWRSFGGTGMVVAIGATAGLLPAGFAIAAVPSLLCIRLTRSTGFSGALFFGTSVVSGWIVHRDEVAALAVVLAAVAVRLKAFAQYRRQ